jgi:hypothetical protein
MRKSQALTGLAWLIVGLAVGATVISMLWPSAGAAYSFTTLRGESTEIYGRGLYQYDSLLVGAGFRGIDAAILLVATPLLAYAVVRYRRGSLRGGLLLLGMTGFFLYNYASMALGAAYNELFVVYVALFSASLFAFVLAFTALNLKQLSARIQPGMPHRALAIFMAATGLVFAGVWLVLGILLPSSQGQVPGELAAYTTLVTHAIDLGVLMPTSFLASVLLWRRQALGYPLAITMLVLGIFIVGLSMPAASVAQMLAGYRFAVTQVIFFIAPFLVLGVAALWLVLLFLRNVDDAQ